jgi:protein-tyrosine phosphatase
MRVPEIWSIDRLLGKWRERRPEPEQSILLVCKANICRSPMAQMLLRQRLVRENLHQKVHVASAGTHVGNGGQLMDPRASRLLREMGVDVLKHRSRPLSRDDYFQFDLILAMDEHNLRHLQNSCPEEQLHKLGLLLQFGPDGLPDVLPDPYFGSIAGFERVFELLDTATRGVLEAIRAELAQ